MKKRLKFKPLNFLLLLLQVLKTVDFIVEGFDRAKCANIITIIEVADIYSANQKS